MTTNVMVRDLDLPVLNATDSRRLEVVVDGLPLFGGSQLAVDTTLVCSLHSDGSPHRGAAGTDGVVFPSARRRKELRYPEAVARVLSCWLTCEGERSIFAEKGRTRLILAHSMFVQTVRCACAFAEGDFVCSVYFAPSSDRFSWSARCGV